MRPIHTSRLLARLPAHLALTLPLVAAPVVTIENGDAGFRFDENPGLAVDDAAAGATIEVIDGAADGPSASPKVLVDGRGPVTEDEPAANFFFRQGSDGGRLLFDLGKPVEIAAINTYSWHRTTRNPQVYTVYGATGDEGDLEPRPTRKVDPSEVGWEKLGDVDTRKIRGNAAGPHVATIDTVGNRAIGEFRYLLFDIRQAAEDGPFGNTFYSEIDVIDLKNPEPRRAGAQEKMTRTFEVQDGKYEFTVDATLAPELMRWVEGELMSDVETWYPKMTEMLASRGYDAPDEVLLEFRDDMGGTPAYAAGSRVAMSVPFFRGQLEGEAKGCVIHELVHVIQNYGLARRAADPKPNPGWLVEGIADYVRWFLYEPETNGARLHQGNIDSARYDGSYRISANFIDWVVREHDEDLLQALNAACREGRYEDELWKSRTGKTLGELNELWIADRRREIGRR